MAVKYIRLETGENGEDQVAPTARQPYSAVMIVKFGFVVLASLGVFVYVSDVLLDMNLTPIKERKPITIADLLLTTPKTDFINQISLVKISDKINTTTCLLPHLDPWDAVIRDYLDPNKNPMKSCKIEKQPRSILFDNGTLNVVEVGNDETCAFRCLFPVDDRNLKFGEWTNIKSLINKTANIYEANPPCDIFDVKCTKGNQIVYKFMHSQIYPKDPKKSQPNAPQPYDLHMIILDSVSMSQGFRSLPMTIHFLRNEMDAIPIPYLNKVGVNSRPNGYAFLMNERASNLPKNPWGKEMRGGRSGPMCDKSLNDETFIGYDFQNNSYKTMLNEDWSMGIFTYPNCKGFSKPPVDHFLKPYMLRVEGSGSYKEYGYNDILFKKICRERHHLVLNNLRNFILKYPNDPKWSLNWNTNLAHDDMNGLYHSDVDFREFFKEMAPRLKNSFIFFMGDHGGRTGKVRNSAIGEYEDNNPMMFMVLPEKLRTNRDLYNQLKENAKQIVSHYDIYATMMEIATTSVKWDDKTPFSSTKFVTNARKLKGSSILHPLPQPRTCDSLLIPFNLCNCQHTSETIEEPKLGIKIGEVIIAKINKDLKASAHANDCLPLTLDKSFSIGLKEYEAGLHKDRRIIKIHLRAKPSDALYEGFVEVRGNQIILVDEDFPRLNMYKEQAACIPQNFFKNYCYCKNYKGGKKAKQ